MLPLVFHTFLIIILGVTSINSLEIQNRIPVRQHAKYDSNQNLQWFPAMIGGVPVNKGEFPSQVSIQTKDGKHLCGGTLIDFDYILTAGHCVTDNLGNVMAVSTLQVMGDDLSIIKNASSTRQVRDVLHIFLHPEYNYFEAANDIAILKTSEFMETNTLQAASITFDSPREGSSCEIAGWGTTKENDKKPNPVLLKATLTITNFQQCNASYAGQLKHYMLCAKGHQQDSCQGDSGGALYCDNEVSGIVSFGNGCDNPGFSGVYTSVNFYGTWIDEVLRTEVKTEPVDNKNCSNSQEVFTWTVLLLVVIFLKYLP